MIHFKKHKTFGKIGNSYYFYRFYKCSIMQYTIAGHPIQIFGEEFALLSGFNCFLSKDANEPLLTISKEKVAWKHDLSPIYSFQYEAITCNFYRKENSYLFSMKQAEGDCLVAEIRNEGDNFQAKIDFTDKIDKNCGYFFLWLLFGVAALHRKTVSIHASTVMYQGKSVLFLGESGTGKSTHTCLWLKHILNTELLNDDSPFIRIEKNDAIRVYGSPWSGKTPCYKVSYTPIAAFVRLSQAPHNHIRPLKGIEALGALLPSCPLVFAYDRCLSEFTYEILSIVLQQIPVYHMECLPDANAARLVFNTLQKDGCL